MQELIKILPLLPVKDGKAELRILEVKGSDFTIVANPKAEVGGLSGVREFTIESPTLKELGIGKGETAHIVASESEVPGQDNYRIEFQPKAAKVAQESVGTGRAATPNFSIQR